jgi:hypothetical protein
MGQSHPPLLHPPFFIEILEFQGASAVSRGRLAEPSQTLADAQKRGEREISTAASPRSPLGFRILDDMGREAFCWRHNDRSD